MSSKRAQSKKERDAADAKAIDDSINEMLQTFKPKTVSQETLATYFIVAFFVSVAPAYLYASLYELPLSDFGLVYLFVTLLAAVLLTIAYKNVAETTNAKLVNSRKGATVNHKKLNLTKEKAESIQSDITEKESIAWSLTLNNAIFVFTFGFLAFYALGAVSTPYNYTLSVTVAAALTWQLSANQISK